MPPQSMLPPPAPPLQETVERLAGGKADAVLSTTIPENPAMLRIFGKLGYILQCQVDMWPTWDTVGRLWP